MTTEGGTGPAVEQEPGRERAGTDGRRTVLVTAATGTVGRHVARALADRRFGGPAVDPLAASRSPARALDQLPAGLGGRELDFARPGTWGGALSGVDGVFLVRPPTVETGAITRFVDAAADSGVERIAYLSTLGADRNVLLPHHRIERHLVDAPVEHVLLRSSFFMQNLHEVHGEDIRERDEIPVPAGDGRTSFVDARDVGLAGATVLAEPGHADAAYELTGPEALSYHEVADVLSDVLGREITYPSPSVVAFLRRMRGRGLPLGFLLVQVAVYTTARLGLADRITDDLRRLLGRPPGPLRSYVRDHADRFRKEEDDDTGGDAERC